MKLQFSIPCLAVVFCLGGNPVAQAQEQLLPPLRPANPPKTASYLANQQEQTRSGGLTLADPGVASPLQPQFARPNRSAATAPPQIDSRGDRPELIRRIPTTEQPSGNDTGLQQAVYQLDRTPARQTGTSPKENALAENLIMELGIAGERMLARYQPMGLHDMLVNCQSNRRQTMVRQYWTTWQACAEYQFAVDELRWLQEIGAPRDDSERMVLEAARSMVADAMAEKELAMTDEQQSLNRFLTGPESETLPWPIDAPLTGHYETHYGAYAAHGSGSPKLQTIDRKIPLQLELILSRAATVHRCRNAILRSTQRYRQTGGSSATMLQALYLSRECHASFLRSVADYNRSIAEYALTVKPGESAPERVVAMLIPMRSVDRTIPEFDRGLRQAALPDTSPRQIPSSNYSRTPITNNGYGRGTDYDRQFSSPYQPATAPPHSSEIGNTIGDSSFSRTPASGQVPAIVPRNNFDNGASSGFQPSAQPQVSPRQPSTFRR